MRFNTNTDPRSSTAMTQALASMQAPGSNEQLVGSNGEINAGSRSELLQRLSDISSMIENGIPQREFASSNREAASLRREAFQAAWNDPEGREFASLGAEMAADITTRVARAGFMRRILARNEVVQGGTPRIRLKEPQVNAVAAVGPTQVGHQIIRGKYFYPNEFYVVANPRVEEIEFNQGSEDLLEEMRLDGQEAIMVKEDRLVIKQVKMASSLFNDAVYFSGSLTPMVLGSLQEQITDWNLPTINCIISNDLTKDITSGQAFNNDYFDPLSRLEIIMTGMLGTIGGMTISTDGFRDPRLKVMERGEIVVTSNPSNVGAYSDRGPVQSEPRTNDKDFPGRGWFMHEIISSAVVNGKGCAVAKRV